MKTDISLLGYKIYRLLLLTIPQKSMTEWPIKQTSKWTSKQDIEQVTDILVKAREKKEPKSKLQQQQRNSEKAKRFFHRDNLQLPVLENPVVWFHNFLFHLNVKTEKVYFLALMWAKLSTGLQNSRYRPQTKRILCVSNSGSPPLWFSGILWVLSHFSLGCWRVHLDTEWWASEQYSSNPISVWDIETMISWKDSTSVSHVSHPAEQCFCWFIATKSLLFQSMTFTIISLQSMTISGQWKEDLAID